MKHQAVHFNPMELALLCNLLYKAMEATGKEFKDQPQEVKLLSTKLAKAYSKLEAKGAKHETSTKSNTPS